MTPPPATPTSPNPSSSPSPAAAVVRAASSALAQSAGLLAQISDAHYTAPSAALGGGTIGQHLRHAVDHYRALIDAFEDSADRTTVVCYDRRARGGPIESDRMVAAAELASLRARIGALDEVQLAWPVHVSVLVSPDEPEVQLASTLGRELWFAVHHGIHHLAMIKAIAAEVGVTMPGDLGRAPATVKHDREARAHAAG